MEITIEDAIEEQLQALARLVGVPVENLVNTILINAIETASVSMTTLYATPQVRAEGRAPSGNTRVSPPRGELADRIRRYITSAVILPSRRKGQSQVKIRAGDVHQDLGLRNRLPAVCAVLGSRRFEETAGVRRVHSSGPANGANAEFLYEL